MIKIAVKTPKKLSGLQSVFIKLDYNEAAINIIKSYQPAIWHKNDLMWELPINYLSKLLDQLTFIDEIVLWPEIENVSSTEEKIGEQLSETEKLSFKEKPFPHQLDAINFGLTHNKWLLLDGMGLGKTFESMCLAETLHRRGLLEHCLVICGVDSLRQNWKSEIKKFSNLDCIVLGEKITKTGKVSYETLFKRAEQLKNEISEFFIIVNITNVRDDKFVEAFKKSKNKIDMIIFDEAHRATKGSQQGSNILKLDAKYKVALTGTPIVNSPMSAYLPLAWTENDHATMTNFKQQYCEFGGFGGSQIVGYKNLDILKEELDSCSLRRTFSQVRGDMPQKTIEYEIVELSDSHRKFYEAIKAGVKEEANKIDLKANNLLALTTRLRQATACPDVLTTDPPSSSKVERAIELAEDILESGEKVLIMSTFVNPCNTIAMRLSKFQPLVCTGEQNEEITQRNIDNFRNSENFNLLIGTSSKIGTGFSMPECHYLIFIDQPWTNAMFAQCCDRIYRITSQQPVYIKVLVCADTIDERVRDIVDTKRDLGDFIVDGVENQFSQELKNILINL